MVKRAHCESLLTTDGAIHAKKLLSFSVAKTTDVYDSDHQAYGLFHLLENSTPALLGWRV